MYIKQVFISDKVCWLFIYLSGNRYNVYVNYNQNIDYLSVYQKRYVCVANPRDRRAGI